jgi:hypothetical protein
MPSPVNDEETAPQPAGIVERLARDDVDRKRFLKMAGSAGAASFGAFVLAACGSSSSSSTSSSTSATAASTAATTASSSSTGDLGILNYALTLEYLETEFYNKVVAAKLFTGATGELVKTFAQQEQEHVDAIKATIVKLGGKPTAKPSGKFPVSDANRVAQLAYTVENLGAAAYLGQAARIKS